MDELQKLRPDRDLQCYFFRPSAAAALSQTSATGLTVSGSWRQQFDWAVIEWNRDDVFQHPSLRPLPDGDLSGLTLSYDETRSNCIPIDSNLFATVDWPILQIWADDGTGEKVYRIPLLNCATAVEGQYQPASAQITLAGTVTPADYVGFSFLEENYTYQLRQDDTLSLRLAATCRCRPGIFFDDVRVADGHHYHTHLFAAGRWDHWGKWQSCRTVYLCVRRRY